MTGIDLVTGGAGFIGSHIVDALVGQGRRVRVVDNFSTGRPENLQHLQGNHQLEVMVGTIADAAIVARAMQGVERVFHIAALADIVPSIERPHDYYTANVQGTFNICQAAAQAGVKRLVYAASSSCYGLPTQIPTPETATIDTRYPYALTKYLGEEIVLHWAKVYKLPSVSLRLFNVYGPRSRTSGTYGAVFGVFLAQLLAGKPLTVVGDGTQTRDFIFVSDVVQAFLAAAASHVSGEAMNVGTSQPQSINTLVKLLGATDWTYIPKRPGEPDITHADTSKIKRLLGFNASVPFAEGVKIMLQHKDYWRHAPVWTSDTIAAATASWFTYLGDSDAAQRAVS